MKRFFVFLTFMCLLPQLKAQEMEYWFVAPDVSEKHNNCDGPTFMVISNPGSTPCEVAVTIDGGTAVSGSPFTIPAGDDVKLNWDLATTRNQIENKRSSAGTVTNKSIHIKVTSGDGVLAYYQVDGSCSKDLFSLKGSYALGDTFYIPGMSDNYYPSNYVDGYDQVDIVAAKACKIKFTPTQAVRKQGGELVCAANTESGWYSLAEGQTFKLMEWFAGNYNKNTNGGKKSYSLAGTQIISDTPNSIAVTVTEDCAHPKQGAVDVIGDQIVPVSCVGTQYIVIKGYTGGGATDRLYFTAAKGPTTVTLIGDGGSSVSLNLTDAGKTGVVDIKNGSEVPQCVYVSSTAPVYCYQVSGYDRELGSALIPSMFSITQQKLAFYNSTLTNNMFLVFRDGCENDFTINNATLSVTAVDLPTGAPTEWKYAKMSIPTTYDGQMVTIENNKSPFSLGYFNYGGGTSGYGYISGFGSFDFGGDTIYQCQGSSTTLNGGYAKSYSWIYTPDSINGTYTTLSETTPSITVNKDGFYAILMDQDPNIVSDTIFIRTLKFDAQVQPLVSLKDTTSVLSVSLNPILTNDPKIKFTYDWTFEGATTTSSTCENPIVNWTGIHRKASVIVTAEATTSNGTTVICDTTINALFVNIEIEPVNKWPESEDGKPVWNSQYDKDNKTSWYGGCDMKFTMTLYPSLTDQTINLRYLEALKKSFIVDPKGNSLKDTYTMPQGDSLLILYFSMIEDSITDANFGKLGAMEAEVVGCGRDTSDWFNLYTNPEYENIYVKPNLRSDKTVDFGITGGSPNLMRSINGRAWRNAYSPLIAAEQLCLTDSAVIWLREPNGCWEAQLFFMSGINPIVTRYVDIQKTDGVTTVPEAGLHYVEGHDDFSFTAAYTGGAPLKVMANGYYSGIYKELIGQDLDNGTYKYTIVQVTEPWNITFGPDLASGTVGNETINGTSVWTYDNMLYIHSAVSTTVTVYNISGTLYKQQTVNESTTNGISLPRGVYVVVAGDARYKVVVR